MKHLTIFAACLLLSGCCFSTCATRLKPDSEFDRPVIRATPYSPPVKSWRTTSPERQR